MNIHSLVLIEILNENKNAWSDENTKKMSTHLTTSISIFVDLEKEECWFIPSMFYHAAPLFLFLFFFYFFF